MSYPASDPSLDVPQRERALRRWDNEGGAGPCGPQMSPLSGVDRILMPEMAEAELGALHVRVIALENLVIALLASRSDQQLELARLMDPHISPRFGFTNHPLTTHAAAHITNLIERALRFRNVQPSDDSSGHGDPSAKTEGQR
jgi:hypothetical protein